MNLTTFEKELQLIAQKTNELTYSLTEALRIRALFASLLPMQKGRTGSEVLAHSTITSSTNSHALSPAPGCHAGHVPTFFAVSFTNLNGTLSTVEEKSFPTTAPVCLTGLVRSPTAFQFTPSSDTKNLTSVGRNIHDPYSCKKPIVIL